MSKGTSDGVECLVIQPMCYEGRQYLADNIHSHLARAKVEKSQFRRGKKGKNYRAMLVFLNSFTQEEKDSISNANTTNRSQHKK